MSIAKTGWYVRCAIAMRFRNSKNVGDRIRTEEVIQRIQVGEKWGIPHFSHFLEHSSLNNFCSSNRIEKLDGTFDASHLDLSETSIKTGIGSGSKKLFKENMRKKWGKVGDPPLLPTWHFDLPDVGSKNWMVRSTRNWNAIQEIEKVHRSDQNWMNAIESRAIFTSFLSR